MVVGDFKHDGKPDLGIASLCVPFFGSYLGEVHGLTGNGDGTFDNFFVSLLLGLAPTSWPPVISTATATWIWP